MNIIEETYPQTLPPTVATIGFFDGVHLGHRYLINQVKIAASQCGWCSSIITFPTHPRQVIQSDYQPQLLSSPEEKIELLASTGIDNCILLPFTQELSRLTAREFMQLLYDNYKVRMLVIGYDHRFGHNRAETFEDYCRYGQEMGIHIMQATAYTQEQDKVSSSAIRRALLSGDISASTKYLGYNYFLEGTVVDGYKVGRKIGFPTANLRVDFSNKLIPSVGVYAVVVHVGGFSSLLRNGTRAGCVLALQLVHGFYYPFRTGNESDSPTSHGVCLGYSVDNHNLFADFRELGNAFMLPIVCDVFVNLV